MRIILICFSALIICSDSFAQETAFGLKGGLNLSTLNLDDPEATYDSRTGYHLGLFVRGKFGNVGIQPELLLYTQNGDIESSIFGTAQERFTYLTIPIMIKFYPIAGFNLQVGPQFGFLLDGERKYDSFLGSGSEDIKEYYKDSDVVVSLGAGYDFPFGLGLDLRYNLGVKDINDVSNGEPAKSRVFMVSLGWNFIRN